MTRKKEWMLGLGIAGGSVLLIVLLVLYISLKGTDREIRISSGGKKIAVIELLGPIYDSRRIVKQFKHFEEQKSIKAIVFRIDSPGGGVAASQEIFKAVKRAREKNKPIVASLGSVAASGGYYVACGADTIMANPGTTTGSIGVKAEFLNVKSLFDRWGIQYDVVKRGRFKNIGSPYQKLSDDEKRHLQSWVDDAYWQFVNVIVEERGLARKKVIRLADGRIFTGQQALKNGLIDLLGDYEAAISLAAELGGISGKPNIVKIQERKPTIFDLIFQRIEDVFRGLNGITLNYTLF